MRAVKLFNDTEMPALHTAENQSYSVTLSVWCSITRKQCPTERDASRTWQTGQHPAALTACAVWATTTAAIAGGTCRRAPHPCDGIRTRHLQASCPRLGTRQRRYTHTKTHTHSERSATAHFGQPFDTAVDQGHPRTTAYQSAAGAWHRLEQPNPSVECCPRRMRSHDSGPSFPAVLQHGGS